MSDKKPKYDIDLRRLEGPGKFPCPECGRTISPDEGNGEVYRIVKTRTRKEELVSMTIECGGCQSQIKLTGFSAKPLEKYENCSF